jgi:hypothetical protein
MPLLPLKPFKTPRRAAAAQVAMPALIPAPVGGLNTRDPISAMDPRDAPILNNLIPRQQGVELRKGYQEHSSAVTVSSVAQSVESIFVYKAPSGANDKVFMATNGNIYDITAGGTPTAVVTGTGSSANEWWVTQFTTAADTFLLAVSPGAGYYTYSATSGWVNRTGTTTGLPTSVRTVAVWKRRVWFTANDGNVYYIGSVDAITGAVTSFPMGSTLRNGGYVSAIVNWTTDAGVSPDDYMVVIGTEGDVSVWQGTDPTSATTFGIVGTWYIGPVPTRGVYFTQLGGDVMIVSELGLVPMSRVFNGQFSIDNQNVGPAAKIQQTFAPLVRSLRTSPYWSVVSVPSSEVLVICLPVDSTGIYRQFAMNMTTGAWCEFSNMPIRRAAVLGGQMYFGLLNGTTGKGLYGNVDGAAQNGTGGSYPVGDVQCAFNAFGSPAMLKKFSMAKPIFYGLEAPAVKATINTQYAYTDVSGFPNFLPSSTALWDSSRWDIARWTASNTYEAWLGLAGLGYFGSLRMKMRGLPGTTFLSSNMLIEHGGVM